MEVIHVHLHTRERGSPFTYRGRGRLFTYREGASHLHIGEGHPIYIWGRGRIFTYGGGASHLHRGRGSPSTLMGEGIVYTHRGGGWALYTRGIGVISTDLAGRAGRGAVINGGGRQSCHNSRYATKSYGDGQRGNGRIMEREVQKERPGDKSHGWADLL